MGEYILVLVNLGVKTVGTTIVANFPESLYSLVVVGGGHVVFLHKHHVS
jgi:hypothetical protein